MNVILIILGVLAGIIALLLILALFSKKGYSLHREIAIKRPADKVFDYISKLKNQDSFNKWAMMDPQMKREYKGVDGTVGFIYGWDGNKKAGAGEQEIKRIKNGESIDIDIRFKRPMKGLAHTVFSTSGTGNETTVRWAITSTMNYPMNVMLLFINLERLLGKDLEESPRNLKLNLEQ